MQETLQAQAIPRSSPGKHRENPNLFLPPPANFQEDLTSLRGNKTPDEEEIAKVNTTLNDTYLGDVFDTVIPNDYSAYPYKEDVTLDVWMPSTSILSSVCPDLNNQRVFKQLQELTGIKLNFIVPTLGEETTDFNLMIASGDLPDIIIDALYRRHRRRGQ